MSILSSLIEEANILDRSKIDATAPKDGAVFSEDFKFVVPEWGETGFELTDHALAQLGSKMGPAIYGKGSNRSFPTDYASRCPAPLRAMQYNYWLLQAQDRRGLFVRRDGNKVRAILDGGYPAIQNREVLNTLDELLEDPGNTYPDQQLVRSTVAPDFMHIRLVFVNTHREDPGNGGTLYAGVHVSNDEIGGGALTVAGIGWNGGCTNSIRFNNVVRITHQYRLVENGATEMRVRLLAALVQVLATTPAYVEKFFLAEEKQLPKLGKVVAELAKEHKWEPTTVANIGAGSNGQETLAGFLNGLTYAAQRLEKVEDQVKMETLAGEYLADDTGLFALVNRVNAVVR